MECRPETELAVLRWLAFSGRTGASSKMIASVAIGKLFAGQNPNAVDFPRDAADFDRCRHLIESIPECWAGVETLAEQNVKWRALRDEWHHIAGMLRAGSTAAADEAVRRAVGTQLPGLAKQEVC